MSICKSIFGKGVYELHLNDILTFFETEQEETSVLEFKSGATRLETIHKEVSAFLNTEGGVLIIGAPTEKARKDGAKGGKVCIGIPDPCKEIVNQDTLMKSIATNISPSPAGIKTISFDYLEGKIFVIEIPQSLTPPHQCNSEGKYYIRLEREAKGAPHGIVEALFLKRQKPDLRGSYTVTCNKNYDILVEFSLINHSLITAENYGFIININGVENFFSSEDINCKIEFNNESISTQNFINSAILVKGIKVCFKLKFKPLYPFLLIDFSYYCKDMQLERVCSIYEIGEASEPKLFNSKESDNKYSSSEIKEYFKTSKEIFYKKFFYSAMNYNTLPANIDHILHVEEVLNTKFPSSYTNFLMTCNGYYGRMGNCFVSLVAITEIVEASKPARIHFSKQRPIVIGEVVEHGPLIIFWDTTKNHYSFGYISTSNNSDYKIVYLGESLIEALKKIMSWN